MDLVGQLRSVVVKTTLDLSELEASYRGSEGPLMLEFRLNWTRAQKERQRALQYETLELQRQYARLKDLVDDEAAWEKARQEADAASEVNMRHWAGWWAEVLLLTTDEVLALMDAIPENHWTWITMEVARRAMEYEESQVKKAGGPRSRTSEKLQA